MAYPFDFPDFGTPPFQGDGSGQPSPLGEMLELRRQLGQLGYPTGNNVAAPVQPDLIPTPGLRIGPVSLSGPGLDSAALSVLGMMQGMRPPQGFGANFGAGLAYGLAGGRARAAQSRAASNQAAVEFAAKRNEANLRATEAARALRQHAIDRKRELSEQADKEVGVYQRKQALDKAAGVGDFKPAKAAEADAGPYMTVQTPTGPKLMRAGEAARLGYMPTNVRESRVPSATERGELVGDIGLLTQVNRVRSLYKPEFVGPVAGRVGGVKQRFGKGAPGEAAFRSGLAAIRNQILKLRSGGAVTDGEAARLLEELPINEDPPDVWEQKMDGFETTFRTLAESRRDVLGGTGVDLSRIPALPSRPAAAGAEAPQSGKSQYQQFMERK